MKLENIIPTEPPVPTVVKRNALELTHELHERGYETDGQVRHIQEDYHKYWELKFSKGKTVYRCELYVSGFMQIIVGHLSAHRNTVDALLKEFDQCLY